MHQTWFYGQGQNLGNALSIKDIRYKDISTTVCVCVYVREERESA